MSEETKFTIRLSKAAKEFNVGIETIRDFLSLKGFHVDSSPNAKLSSEMYASLAREFPSKAELEKLRKLFYECIVYDEKHGSENFNTKTISSQDGKLTEPVTVNKVYKECTEKVEKKDSDKTAHKKKESQKMKELTGQIGKAQKVCIKAVSETGRVYFDGTTDFQIGVLFPQNILYNGHPLPIDITESMRKNFSKNIGQQITVSLIEQQIIHDRKVVFFQYELPEVNKEDVELFSLLNENEEYSLSVFSIGNNYIEFRFPNSNLRGFIESKVLDDKKMEIGESVKLVLGKKGASPFHLMHFLLPNVASDVLKEEVAINKEEKLLKLLSKIEIDNISDNDRSFIESIITNHPNIPLNQKFFIDESLHIYCNRFSKQETESTWKAFVKQKGNYLPDHCFYVRYCSDNAEINVYNEDDVVMVFKIDSIGFILDEIYFGRKKNWAGRITNNSSRCLRIEGSNIHILDVYNAIPIDYDWNRVVSHLLEMEKLYFEVLPQVKKNTESKRMAEGESFYVLKDLIEYEKIVEENKVGSIIVIDKDANIQRCDSKRYKDGIAFQFTLNRKDYERLSNNEEGDEELYVTLVDSEGKPLRTGRIIYDMENQKAIIEFPKNRDIDSTKMREGFNLKRKSSVGHLNIQAKAIDGFTKNKKFDGLFDNIITKRIEVPDVSPYKDISFYNNNIQNASSENKQPEAVKKALGNKKIVLIQGPPGTGKTTVIIEIIRQLVKENKKVLVCSQAHAAVNNIVDKLKNINEISFLSIDNEGDVESWGEDFDNADYQHFLLNNQKLIMQLKEGNSKGDLINEINGYLYKSKAKSKYMDYHKSIVERYSEEKRLFFNAETILDRLLLNDVEMDSNMLNTYRYQSMDVILGTCIGVGMNNILKSESIHFDTVIIDEAAKANLAEALVPMSKANRCVLVGDHKQLPPYLDNQLIEGYIRSKNRQSSIDDETEADKNIQEKLDKSKIVEAMSTSLFELLLENGRLPQENLVMLNFQYRMHPDIGEFISKVFYDGQVKMGEGTHSQYIPLPIPYDKSYVFVDIDERNERTTNRTIEREENTSFINEKEIEIICKDICPTIIKANLPEKISVGIITPYSAQRDRLRKELSGTDFKDSVFTIDSIQGMEFDIVVFSFVRSFPDYQRKTVGFLDDMRRLNVSLSRAKKKLILVGSRQTLNRESSHREETRNVGKKPVDVFKAITTRSVNYTEAKKSRVFHEKYKCGDLISCKIIKLERGKLYFSFVEDGSLRFSMSTPKAPAIPWNDISTITVRYDLDDSSNNPIFSLVSYNDTNGCSHTIKSWQELKDNTSIGDEVDVCVKSIDHPAGVKVDYWGFEGLIPKPKSERALGWFRRYEDYRKELQINDIIRVKVRLVNEQKFIFNFIFTKQPLCSD